MMLTAIQASCTPLVFAHNRTPTGMASSSSSQQALSPDSSPMQQQHQQQPGQSCIRGIGGRNVDGSKVPLVPSMPPGQVFSNQGYPQIIPLPQSFFLGMGGAAGYTLVPSIMQQSSLPSSERTMVGIQPLGTLPRPTAVLPITAVSGYYGRAQPELPQPMSFQTPLATSSADQQRSASTSTLLSLTPVPSPAGAATVSSPQQQQQPSQQLHPLLTSGAGIRPILNGTDRTDFSTAPTLQSIPSPNISGDAVGVHKMSILISPQSSLPSQSHSSLGRTSTPSSSSVTTISSSSSCLSSESELHHHHHQQIDQEQEPRGRKRPAPHHDDIDASHSYSKSRTARQQAARFSSTPVPSSASSMCTADENSYLHDVRIKREPLTEDMPTHRLPHSTRRNSDSNLEEAASSSSKSYQISALIDTPPMAPALNRASRTSSLSSSSFRFGGSLSQLWASQISLGKINNMKSTGNLNAEAGILPSLGNQYVAFGGSLPELSLTSLSRLLPNSSSDPSLSCHSIFTVPAVYFYPNQHLTTPLLNPHGPITFGNLLSNVPNLSSSSKGLPGESSPVFNGSSGNASTTERAEENRRMSTSGRSADVGSSRDDGEENLDVGCGGVSVGHPPVSSTVSGSVQDTAKLPAMYSPTPILSAGINRFKPGVITTSHAFGMLARETESNSMDMSSSSDSSADQSGVRSHSHSMSANQNSSSSSSPPISSSRLSNMETLGGHVIHQLHPQPPTALIQGMSASNPTHPLTLLSQPHPHLRAATTPNCPPEHRTMTSPTQSELYLVGGPRGQEENILQPVAVVGMNGVKLERDLEPLDYDPTLNIHPIMSHEGGGGVGSASLHSPPHEQQQTVDRHLLMPGSGMMVANGSNVGMVTVKKEKEKPYKCEHPGCGRTFSFPAHLRSHTQQIHISYRPCQCEFPGCGKRFYTPQHLNVHRRVHTGERPFVCPYADCSKAFTTAGNLKNHIRTHTGERPYACKFEGCSKRFAEMSSLKKHELTHTGEKPYKCRVCGKAFSQAGSRNTHERKHNRIDGEELGSGGGGVSVAEVGGTTGGSDAIGKGPKKYRIRRISGGTIVDNKK